MVEFDRELYPRQACVIQAAQNAADFDEESAQIRRDTARLLATPFMMLRPRITLDGDRWCVLYGENIQDGVVGFGVSPEEAERAFNAAWVTKISPKAATDTQNGGAKG